MPKDIDDKDLKNLLDNNRQWAAGRVASDAAFFDRLQHVQAPDYLWIGCSDSRVPANEIVGLPSGEMFVHRNIGNVVPHSDVNCLAVIQYAVEVLKVGHIIVTGHYGCGGIKAAMEPKSHGTIDNWLAHIKDIYRAHYDEIMALEEGVQADRLCELNVAAQVKNVAKTSIVQNAWRGGHALQIHGWIYSLSDGIIRDLDVGIGSADQLHDAHRIEG